MHMKKLLYTIGFLMMISAALQPTGLLHAEQFSGKEEDVPFSAARLSSKITSAIGLNPAANWMEIFGKKDDKDVGKDLYMVIYKKTQDEPQKQAGKNIAGKYGMPEADMVRILQGDYTKMIEKKPGMTQEEAMKKISEIQQLYAEEKDILQLKADIKAAVEPNEIFANGDINDSGFDLINDLQIIENLLFLKSDPIDVGGTFGAGGEEAGEEGATGSTSQPSTGGTGGTGGGTGSGSGAGGTGGTGSTGQAVSGADGGTSDGGSAGAGSGTGGTSQPSGKLNPNSCFGSGELGKALAEFEARKADNPQFKDKSQGAAPYAGTGGAGGGGTGSGTTGGGASGESPTGKTSSALGTDFMPPKPDNSPAAAAAPADNWLKEKLCPGFFCLDVKFIMKPATSSYQNADNCIACHAEKINDTLKKVINHTLVPSKAPGNLGESAKCKKAVGTAFGSISMNFYAVAMPVLTPVNDDLVYGTNIEDDWYNYCNAVAFPFSCRKEKAPASPEQSNYVVPATITDMASKKEISYAQETLPLETLSRNVETAAVGLQNERQQNLVSYSVSQKADNAIGYFNPLKVELNLMNYYFSNIRDLLHSLHEKVNGIPGDPACTKLRDKKTCT
jgi:hypothetical protein